MKVFDIKYLHPRVLLPMVLISFILLSIAGYTLTVNSEPYKIATEEILRRSHGDGSLKIVLLPWGFKVRYQGDDGDAKFTMYLKKNTGNEKVEVFVVGMEGKWVVEQIKALP